MDKPGVWITIAVAGLIVGTISALHQYTTKETPFRIRPVVRDFCLGSFLAAAVYMFLPDSIDSWISASSKMLGDVTAHVPAPPAVDIELQTGPARF